MSIDIIAFHPTDPKYADRAYSTALFVAILDLIKAKTGTSCQCHDAPENSQMLAEVEPEETDRIGAVLLQAIQAAPADEDLQSPLIKDFAQFLVHCKGFRWF